MHDKTVEKQAKIFSLFNIVECSLKLSRMASNHLRAQQKKWTKCGSLAWAGRRRGKRKLKTSRKVKKVVDNTGIKG